MYDSLLNTEFRELENEVWTNSDRSKVLRKDSSDTGYDGCSAVNSVANSNCDVFNRWAYIEYSFFETGGSPIDSLTNEGTISGVYQCWSDWGSFGDCDSPCGIGVQRRYRSCGGGTCSTRAPGSDSDSRPCNTHTCREFIFFVILYNV